MAVPKRKHSNSRTGKRRSQDAKTPRQIEYCPQCSKVVPSHAVCPNCGFYMGRKVVDIET
jgi:large subunit ribosomal protein L32